MTMYVEQNKIKLAKHGLVQQLVRPSATYQWHTLKVRHSILS